MSDLAQPRGIRLDNRWLGQCHADRIRLIDNHLDEHHMHRYDGPNKQQPGERFATGEPRVVLPQAIRHLLEGADATISSWKSPQ